jgi:hypothetical protein
VREDGTPVKRPPIEPVEGLHTVYNFEVAEHHTYIAGGWRVHNDSVEIASCIGSSIGGIIADALIRQLGIDNFALNSGVRTLGRAFVRSMASHHFATQSAPSTIKNCARAAPSRRALAA